jgi:hypothetical protein
VVLQKVLADRVNQGYHELSSLVIDSCDGKKVRSLAHLVELCETSNEPFLRFEAVDGAQIVIDRLLCRERAPHILRKFSVPADRSPDLRTNGSERVSDVQLKNLGQLAPPSEQASLPGM